MRLFTTHTLKSNMAIIFKHHKHKHFLLLLSPFTFTFLIISLLPPSLSLSLTLQQNAFLQCFSSNLPNPNTNTTLSHIIFTPDSSSYQPLLQSSIRNGRFYNTTSTSKPNFIITPNDTSHVQTTILCSKQQGLQIRVRSGGHDYEGLSYVSNNELPFIVLDLFNLRSIKINIVDETAWVQSGATLGELYYEIAKASNIHGFPAGSCPTVGVGGHFSGGGFGTIFRKYGLAADQVVDAEIVDSNGKLLNRTLMGEDLFWAIRGGGGSSFGVITAWKVKLPRVPPKVTIFEVSRTLDQNASSLFQKWQSVAHELPGEIFLHAVMGVVDVSSSSRTVQISFTGLYLGPSENVVTLMETNFAELGLQRNNCMEMSWIQSVLYFAGFSSDSSMDVLLRRNHTSQSFKAKSDYVTQPIPMSGLTGLWRILLENSSSSSSRMLILTPYGGRMSEISESETPFPHRSGNMYGIQYTVSWNWDEGRETEKKNVRWMRRLYAYMGTYVSRNPRGAYFNYRDLDLGVNRGNWTRYDYEEARRSWGLCYFKNNFERLAKVKALVDVGNFFRDQQSIPPFSIMG